MGTIRTTHISSMAEMALKLHAFAGNQKKNTMPAIVLSEYLALHPSDPKFLRILSWVVSFSTEGRGVLEKSNLAEKTKVAALSNLSSLGSPFSLPLSGQMGTWFSSAMSQTNQSYFDLLSDLIINDHAIYVPDQEDLNNFAHELLGLLSELEEVGLPRWINDDFKNSIEMTILAIEKLPFLAHKIVQDANNVVLARLFSTATPEHRRFMVKVATTINIVFAAFVMPHEASEAAKDYYKWIYQSPISQSQIDACAAPLALPPPNVDTV